MGVRTTGKAPKLKMMSSVKPVKPVAAKKPMKTMSILGKPAAKKK